MSVYTKIMFITNEKRGLNSFDCEIVLRGTIKTEKCVGM